MLYKLLTQKKKLKAPWEKYYQKKDLDYVIPDISIYKQVKLSKDKNPQSIAIEYYKRKITYQKFLKQIDIAACGFYHLGVRKGDIVTVLLPNIPEVLISLYAINKLGAILNMTHPLSAVEEIRETLISTKSQYLIIYDEIYEKVKDLVNDLHLKKVIYVSPANSLSWLKKVAYYSHRTKNKIPKKAPYISWKLFFSQAHLQSEPVFIEYGKNTPAVILHSGGTSGKPKNIVIQNSAFIFAANGEEIDLVKLAPGDSALAIMPNFHGFGLSVLMHTPLALGYKTILVPKFDSQKFDTLFKQTKPTCVLGVPTLFEALINSKNEKDLDLSFLKYVISGGDILPHSLEIKVNEYLQKHYSNARITQGYGLSEALACVTMAHDDINKSGSVGIPLAGNYIKIIDPATRKNLPYLKVGEIVIHSQALMMGYLNDEKETNEALQVHDDGYVWLHTGDLGYMDSDGFLFYTGRIKRMIISSGYNVYPSHIEEVIESHPAVLQCSVVGIPHPYKQEVARAYIVLKEELSGSLIKKELDKISLKSDIRAYCSKKLAKYMLPSEIIIRKSLPKTKLGKIDFERLKNGLPEDE